MTMCVSTFESFGQLRMRSLQWKRPADKNDESGKTMLWLVVGPHGPNLT